jgi:hypothetical protein
VKVENDWSHTYMPQDAFTAYRETLPPFIDVGGIDYV